MSSEDRWIHTPPRESATFDRAAIAEIHRAAATGIYDIRGFTAASKRLRTADLGAFATGAHRVVLDQFAAQHIGGLTRFPSLVLSGEGAGLSWTRTGALIPAALSLPAVSGKAARIAALSRTRDSETPIPSSSAATSARPAATCARRRRVTTAPCASLMEPSAAYRPLALLARPAVKESRFPG